MENNIIGCGSNKGILRACEIYHQRIKQENGFC